MHNGVTGRAACNTTLLLLLLWLLFKSARTAGDAADRIAHLSKIVFKSISHRAWPTLCYSIASA
jgi:hypothetical protein